MSICRKLLNQADNGNPLVPVWFSTLLIRECSVQLSALQTSFQTDLPKCLLSPTDKHETLQTTGFFCLTSVQTRGSHQTSARIKSTLDVFEHIFDNQSPETDEMPIALSLQACCFDPSLANADWVSQLPPGGMHESCPALHSSFHK